MSDVSGRAELPEAVWYGRPSTRPLLALGLALACPPSQTDNVALLENG
jgi:hypothetical protein